MAILLGNEEYISKLAQLASILRDRGQGDIDEELLGIIFL